MTSETLSPIRDTLRKLQAEGKLPKGLPPSQLVHLEKALAKYTDQVSDKVLAAILADWQDKLASAASLDSPGQQRGIIADLRRYVEDEDVADSLEFALKISQEVASGAGQYLNQNLSPEAIDEFPALELRRLFERDVPRGFKRGKKGVLIAVPDDDWPSRWAAAGAECGDEDWLPWEGSPQTGRGVALKSSGIWQSLGDGAGGYEDTLGNPFPPFAFNSGFMTFDVSRDEAVKLELIGADEEAKGAAIDMAKLFSDVDDQEEAA